MSKALERLNEMARVDSSWLEKAQWRQDNRAWLRRSFQIAVMILGTLKEKGISQKALAEMMDVTPQYINKIVKGKENLSLETITRLEAALGMRLIEIPEQKGNTIDQAITTNDKTGMIVMQGGLYLELNSITITNDQSQLHVVDSVMEPYGKYEEAISS